MGPPRLEGGLLASPEMPGPASAKETISQRDR